MSVEVMVARYDLCQSNIEEHDEEMACGFCMGCHGGWGCEAPILVTRSYFRCEKGLNPCWYHDGHLVIANGKSGSVQAALRGLGVQYMEC